MNDLKLQEGLQPIDKHLRPIKVGDEISALEISTEDVRVRNLQITGTMTGNIVTTSDFTLDCAGSVFFDSAIGEFNFYDDGDTADYCSLTVVGGTGATTLATTSAGSDGDIALDSSRMIILDAANTNSGAGIQLLSAGTKIGAFEAHHGYSGLFLYENAGATTDDALAIQCYEHGATTIATVDSAGTAANLTLDPDGELNFTPTTEVKSDAPLKVKEAANAVADTAAYGQIWVKTATPNELYFTTDAGDDIQLTSGTSAAGGGGGGTSRWAHSWGGYKTNNCSTSVYYMQYYPNNNNWNNSESSPTTIGYFDMYSAEWIAPANGTLTKIDVFVRGGTDDCQFYVFKGAPSETGSSSISLTQIGASGACGIDSASQTFHQTAAISSSNTFSAGEGLWIMIKKEAHSSNQSFYFSGTISGEYS